MRWICIHCRQSKTTNGNTPQKPTSGCPVAKDRMHVWKMA